MSSTFVYKEYKERWGRDLTYQYINRRPLCFLKGGHFQDDVQQDFKSLPQLETDAGGYLCELEYSEEDQKQTEEEKEEEEEEAAAAV